MKHTNKNTFVPVKNLKPYQLYRNSHWGITYILSLVPTNSYTSYRLENNMTFLVLETKETDLSNNDYSYFVKILTIHGIHWFYPGDNSMFEELVV